jgi:hypothetical protein
LPKDDASTSFFQSSENYGDKAFLSSIKDYPAVMTISGVADSLPMLEPIIIVISEGDVEGILDLSFELTNYFKLRKQGLDRQYSRQKQNRSYWQVNLV